MEAEDHLTGTEAAAAIAHMRDIHRLARNIGNWLAGIVSAVEMGRAIGTPRYMSPEQAEGRWDELGPAPPVG